MVKHPGEVILNDFIKKNNLTQAEVAKALNIPYQRLNGITTGKRAVSPQTALLLGKYFGIDARYFLRLQNDWDLHEEMKVSEIEIVNVTPFRLENHGHFS